MMTILHSCNQIYLSANCVSTILHTNIKFPSIKAGFQKPLVQLNTVPWLPNAYSITCLAIKTGSSMKNMHTIISKSYRTQISYMFFVFCCENDTPLIIPLVFHYILAFIY